MLIDSHAHLTFATLKDDPEAMIARAKAAGIEAIININTSPQEIERGETLSSRHPWIYQVAATHPHDVAKVGEEQFEPIAQKARLGALVAIGEIGLDYFYKYSTPEVQRAFLARYFQLAQECHLPVVIHCREAFDDLFAVADEHYQKGPALLHCFTGSMKELETVLARGWMVSFSGIVTFKKSQELRECAKIVPHSRLLIETDTPFLAPQSHRGKPNEPAYLVETAHVMAEVLGLSFEELAKLTTANARRFFKL
ncbi:MAG: D-aminoacyl-tRNA deacylase [Chlamydiae bacterium]|nr:D-aminoacyl-tRNA deacylase [Chlamydiota bacterium]